MSRLLLNQSVGFKKFKMWGWEEEEGSRVRAWFAGSCGAAASAWGSAVAVHQACGFSSAFGTGLCCDLERFFYCSLCHSSFSCKAELSLLSLLIPVFG